jgi:hypothetical protein
VDRLATDEELEQLRMRLDPYDRIVIRTTRPAIWFPQVFSDRNNLAEGMVVTVVFVPSVSEIVLRFFADPRDVRRGFGSSLILHSLGLRPSGSSRGHVIYCAAFLNKVANRLSVERSSLAGRYPYTKSRTDSGNRHTIKLNDSSSTKSVWD